MLCIAAEVALGIMMRFEKDESGIKILILMNKPNSKDRKGISFQKKCLNILITTLITVTENS